MARFNKGEAQNDYLKAMAASFDDPSTASDLLVICNGRTFKCHRHILTRRSKWFDKACHGKFNESGASKIELHEEDDEEVIRAMLEFCYRFEYAGPSERQYTEIEFHLRVFAAGEKYFVHDLRDLATDHFMEALRKGSTDDLGVALPIVYHEVGDPDKILRSAMIQLVVEQCPALLDGTNAAVNNLLATIPAFGGDIARALAKKQPVWHHIEYRYWDQIETAHPDYTFLGSVHLRR